MIRALAAVLAVSSPAVAAHLAAKYGESIVSQGVVENIAVMQVWANTTTGTWTFLLVSTDGAACIVSSGGSFDAIAAPAKGDPV